MLCLAWTIINKLTPSLQAKAYLLDPLTAPEPSQETGPGSSFINPNPLLRTFSQRKTGKDPVQSSDHPESHRSHGSRSNHSRSSSFITPPASASPSRSSFHSSNPFSSTYNRSPLPSPSQHAPSASPVSPSSPRQSFIRSTSGRSNGGRGPASPSSRYPPSTSDNRSFSARVRAIGGEGEDGSRAYSFTQRSRSASNNDDNNISGLHRSGSLNQKFPGDMSHRPLDMLKREQRAADRAPHRRARKSGPMPDTIDSLDTIGGVYHHDGPYEATLAARNRNRMYAPVEAVKDSNMEALKATPREYIQDSLDKHVPLQGIGVIPAGCRDMSGNVMDYEEGADLMREPDAEGGAYKRWDGVPYHPDDLKGKGEPSYTYEKDRKEKKRLRKGSLGTPAEYEMQHGVNGQQRRDLGRMGRQRSASNAADGRPEPSDLMGGQSNSADIRRHNSTGKRFSEGLKRRFGSIRRKHHASS